MNLDDELHGLLNDDAASATPSSDSLDARPVVRRARRRRAAAIATTAVVSAAVIAVFVLSLSVLLPREGDDTQPGGPGVANATVEPWTDQMTHLPLEFVSLDYPSTWYALVGDSQTGPEPSIDTVQITNFDPGFDDNLCLTGGSEIPRSGIVFHLSSAPLPFKIGAAETREDAAATGAKIPQSCESSEVYADHLDGMWIVLVAGPDVAASDLDAFMTTIENTAEPEAAESSIGLAGVGPAAVLGTGSAEALTLQYSPDQVEASLLYVSRDHSQSLWGLTSIPDSLDRVSLIATGTDGGQAISILGLTGADVATVRYQSVDGTTVFDTPAVRVPASAFKEPVRAFAGTGPIPDGPIEGRLTAFDANGSVLLDADLAPFGLTGRSTSEIDVTIDVDQAKADADAALARAATAATTWFGSNASYTSLTSDDLESLDPNIRVCLGQDCGLDEIGGAAKDGVTVQMAEPFEDFVTFRALIPTGTYDGFVRCLVVRGSAIGEIRDPSDPNPTNGCASSDEFIQPAITDVLLDRAQAAAERWEGHHGTFAGMTPSGLSEIAPNVTWCDGLDQRFAESSINCTPPVASKNSWPPQVTLTYVDDASAVFNVTGGVESGCVTVDGGSTKTYPLSASTPEGCSDAAIQDKAAQSALRNALVAGKTIFTDCDCFTRVTVKEMGLVEPSIEYKEGGLGRPLEVSIRDIGRDTMLLVTRSRSGHEYCIADIAAPASEAGTFYGTTDAQTIGDCHKPRWPENGEYP